MYVQTCLMIFIFHVVIGCCFLGGASEVRARALLCPLTGKGQPVPMPYRTLNIGTGEFDEPLLLVLNVIPNFTYSVQIPHLNQGLEFSVLSFAQFRFIFWHILLNAEILQFLYCTWPKASAVYSSHLSITPYSPILHCRSWSWAELLGVKCDHLFTKSPQFALEFEWFLRTYKAYRSKQSIIGNIDLLGSWSCHLFLQ